jgi:hypothetical protein
LREAYSLVWSVLVLLFRSRVSLEAEILILRHQLNIQRRHQPKRLAFSAVDRLILVGLYRLAPNTIKALTIVKPDTVIRWHRAGFRLYWRWKSRQRCGRPTVPLEIRRLIREISIANPLWGAPRIHGELLKLGIDVGQTGVAKYMAHRRAPPSQGWVQAGEYQTVQHPERRPFRRLPPQHVKLMTHNGVFSLKRGPRPERSDQRQPS